MSSLGFLQDYKRSFLGFPQDSIGFPQEDHRIFIGFSQDFHMISVGFQGFLLQGSLRISIGCPQDSIRFSLDFHGIPQEFHRRISMDVVNITCTCKGPLSSSYAATVKRVCIACIVPTHRFLQDFCRFPWNLYRIPQDSLRTIRAYHKMTVVTQEDRWIALD